jgi:O-antigen ligase
VSAVAGESVGALLWRRWRDPAAWATTADIFAGLIAVSLPWSTSLVAIFATAFLVTVAPSLDVKSFLPSLKRPICALPIALFALAAVGTLWSDAPWGARLYAIGPTAKLLMLPVLFYHFERSARGVQVFTAFLVSCALLMGMSWIVAFDPALALKSEAEYGVPVKNYIDQSQEFALCAVVLAYPVVTLLRANRIWLAALLITVSLSFVVNMLFVSVSRTALVTMPIMLAVFALLHLRWRNIVIIACATVVLGALAWAASPTLRWTMVTFERDYQIYKELDQPTSLGLRLEFWKKSLGFFAEAPIIGHGTGSTRGLFEQAATGPKVLAAGQVVANPHNQTLNVAIQWGVLGVVVLYAMWLFHLRLFRGEGLVAWIGLMVVVQNFFTSLFNSHIFDFHEGWMYVLGVGIAGGMTLNSKFGETANGGIGMKAGMHKGDELSAGPGTLWK